MSQITKVIITDVAEDLVPGLESISASIENTRGVSLHSSVKEFLNNHIRALRAQHDVKYADEYCTDIAISLYRHLKNDGFDARILKCKGFTKDLKDCSQFTESAIRELGVSLVRNDMIQFVVQVNNVILDLSYRRMGSEYLHSNNTIKNTLKNYWKEIEAVDPRNCASNEAFLRYARSLVQESTLHRLLGKKADNDAGQSFAFAASGEMVVTAAAVVDAFSKAKRVRKLRVVAKATASSHTKVRVD